MIEMYRERSRGGLNKEFCHVLLNTRKSKQATEDNCPFKRDEDVKFRPCTVFNVLLILRNSATFPTLFFLCFIPFSLSSFNSLLVHKKVLRTCVLKASGIPRTFRKGSE